MNRKIMFSLVIIVMALALVIGGTFAWFTAVDEVTNTFVAGTVLFDLDEYMESDSAVSVDQLTAPNVNPGDCYTKNFTIVNTGTKYILLRMNFEEEWTFNAEFLSLNADALGFDLSEDDKITLFNYGTEATYAQVSSILGTFDENPVKWADIEAELIAEGWIYNSANEYWYHENALEGTFNDDAEGDELKFSFKVCFDGNEMENEYQGATYTLTIGVEAIQASNNASGLGGWEVDSWYFNNGDSEALGDPELNTTGENWSEWDPENDDMQYPTT